MQTEDKIIDLKFKGNGHVQEDCPNNRVISLQDVKEIDAFYSSKEIEVDEEEEKVQIEGEYD